MENDNRAISGKPEGMIPYTQPDNLYDKVYQPASIPVGPTQIPAMGRVGNVAVPAVKFNAPLEKPLDIPFMPSTYDIGPTVVPGSERVGGVVVPSVQYGVGSEVEWEPGKYPFIGGVGPDYAVPMRYSAGIRGISVPEAGHVGGVAVPEMTEVGGIMVPATNYVPTTYYGTGLTGFLGKTVPLPIFGHTRIGTIVVAIAAMIAIYTGLTYLKKKKIIKFNVGKSKWPFGISTEPVGASK